MSDKTYVKVSANPQVKVSDGQTIVKEIRIGAPIKRVDGANFNAKTLNGDSASFYLDYNNFTNTPNVLDSAQIKLFTLDSSEVVQIVDSSFVQGLTFQNIADSASGTKLLGSGKVGGHFIPTADQQYDLGSFDKKFRALYISGQTVFLGSLALSDDGSGGVAVSPVAADGTVDSSSAKSVAFNLDSASVVTLVQPSIDSAITALIDAAPEQLNTLNELAAALNDDSNAFSTLTDLANSKLDSAEAIALIDSAYVQARVADANIGAPTDGSYGDGFVPLTSTTKIADGIDLINEALFNLANDNFVQSVTFTGSPTSGGEGMTTTLALTVVGNPNRFDITWGDGSVDSGTLDTTPSHTYTSNAGSPYDVTVRAFNTNAVGSGSEASLTRNNFIIVFTADPVMGFELYRNSSGGVALTGNERYVIQGQSLHMKNTTTNTTMADVIYTMNWGDGSTNDTITGDSASGGVLGTRLAHTWGAGTASGTGLDTLTLTLDSHTTADPSVIPRSGTLSLKVYDPNIAAPNLLATKTLSLGFSSSGTSPQLASGFTDNVSGGSSLSAGSNVTRTTSSSTLSTNTLSSFTYNADSGDLIALINGAADGTITMTNADNTGSNSAIQVTDEQDYNLLNAAGSSTSFNNSIYHPGLYKGYKAKINKAATVGVNSWQMTHGGSATNTLEFVRDDLTSTPAVSAAGTLTQTTAGTFRYISGIPYYNSGSPSLTLAGATITNLTGQTYTNQSNIVEVLSGTNYEGTSQSAISTQSFTYANIDGASTMLSSGIPTVNVGTSSAYAIGSLAVPITTSGVRTVESLSIRARNVNGVGSSGNLTEKIQVHTAAQSGISEIAIAVADALGSTFDDDGIRITDFKSETTNNPSFTSSTNFYTNAPYSEASDPGVAGTKEATVRLGVIKHDVTNYSTGFLPAGPNRSGDTGTQYFTFAFRRAVVANFNINMVSSGVAGVWIAAPGTTIDNTSSINGWLDCSGVYGGSGVPGANTGSGGNGSNGCAANGGEVIAANTSLNGSFTMTLGTENLTNATGNVALVRIALTSGQSVTSLSIT